MFGPDQHTAAAGRPSDGCSRLRTEMLRVKLLGACSLAAIAKAPGTGDLSQRVAGLDIIVNASTSASISTPMPHDIIGINTTHDGSARLPKFATQSHQAQPPPNNAHPARRCTLLCSLGAGLYSSDSIFGATACAHRAHVCAWWWACTSFAYASRSFYRPS
jgi:hypothetical protein